MTLTMDNGMFLLDGKPFQIYSGAIHYFRVLPEYWRDRLLKLKAAGFNTVETYVCWNLHEPKKGEYDFSGRLDLVRFIETAKELGLFVIGIFACAVETQVFYSMCLIFMPSCCASSRPCRSPMGGTSSPCR